MKKLLLIFQSDERGRALNDVIRNWVQFGGEDNGVILYLFTCAYTLIQKEHLQGFDDTQSSESSDNAQVYTWYLYKYNYAHDICTSITGGGGGIAGSPDI